LCSQGAAYSLKSQLLNAVSEPSVGQSTENPEIHRGPREINKLDGRIRHPENYASKDFIPKSTLV